MIGLFSAPLGNLFKGQLAQRWGSLSSKKTLHSASNILTKPEMVNSGVTGTTVVQVSV